MPLTHLLPRTVATVAAAALLLCVAMLAPAEGRQEPAQPPVRNLGHTMQRLRRDKALVVGYFGGSITEGAGASNAGKTSWRALTTAYLREHYPGANITEVNAAIGGTGSDLGAFRCQSDLLNRKPDLVFVEFAVNDGGAAEERTLRAMEGIVRQIRRANPQTDLVFVYTANKGIADAYSRKALPASVERHQRIARYYGIPQINVGEPLYQKIATEHGGDWNSLTKDGTHPNDEGYALYAGLVTAFLEAHKDDTEAAPPTLPVPLSAHPLENGRLVDAWTLPETSGWTKEDKSLSGRYPHYLSATGPSAGVLTYPFQGDAIGLYWQIAPDSGDIEWSIDNSPWKRVSSWDRYALKFTRANYTLLNDSLTPGSHELRIRVLADHNPESTGTTIRLGALLVDGAPASVRP